MILQEKIFDALSAALSAPVIKYKNEYDDNYPVVTYDEIKNEPVLFGDDIELLRRVTYKVSIGTLDDDYDELARIVGGTMRSLGFTRVDANSNVENGVYWREISFSKIIGGR